MLVANGVALMVVLGTLHLVSGRVLRESASVEGLRGAGDRGGAAMGDEPR